MDETVIAGIPIPSTSPWFLAGVAVHVAFGVTAAASGLAAMLSRKGPGRHPRFGTAYVWALAGLCVTSAALTAARWNEDWPLFMLGLAAFAAALAGRTARRRAQPGWPRVHLVAMGGSYVLMLTAFYVDNGPNLPLWRLLPPLAFWLGPALVGAPTMLLALWRHPLARRPGVRR